MGVKNRKRIPPTHKWRLNIGKGMHPAKQWRLKIENGCPKLIMESKITLN